jgi:hypothetical protein
MKASQIAPDTLVSRAVNVLFTTVDDDALAIDEQAGYFYVMNESSSRVWELIKEPIAVSAVCAQLGQEFTVDEATCQREVLELLQGLHEAGLVQINER